MSINPGAIPREGSRDTGDGILVSTTPDICLTPVGSSMVPVAYNLWASQADDANTTTTVRQTKLRTHNMGSLITTCHGDEAGTGGGIRSGTHNGICEPKEHSATVRSEGKNVIRHNDIWWMNNRNTVGRLLWIKTPDEGLLTPQSAQPWLAGAMYAQAAPKIMTDAAPVESPVAPPVETPLPPTGNVVAGPWPGSAEAIAAAEAEVTAAEAEVVTATAASAAASTTAGEEGLGAAASWETFVGPIILGATALGTLGVAGYGIYSARKRLREAQAKLDELKKQQQAAQAGRTEDNCKIAGQQPEPPCPCTVGKYKDVRKLCKGACGTDAQAHHIAPDRMFRYGTRKEGEAGKNRIPGKSGDDLLAFDDGPAICLKGNARTDGTEHNTAHKCDNVIEEKGATSDIPGTISAVDGITIATAGAINARPDCAAQINKIMDDLLNNIDPDTLLRSTEQPPKPESPAYDLFNPPAKE